MTTNQAQNYACQRIILEKIKKSPFAEKITIKGGVVMFNLTKNLRRATMDLDFDFVRYGISEQSIHSFVNALNHYDTRYRILVVGMKALHHEDYRGKRVLLLIEDYSESLPFKLDIGVHTLTTIEQEKMCFRLANEGDAVALLANPPEQIFAEKAYSLAKHGSFSRRFKDVFDMFFLIEQCELNRSLVQKCLDLLTLNQGPRVTRTIVCELVQDTLSDPTFLGHLSNARERWLDVGVKEIAERIIEFLERI